MRRIVGGLIAVAIAVVGSVAQADTIGEIKTAEGQASILRGTETLKAVAGAVIELDDEILTSADGAVGIGLADGTMVSIGHSGHLVIDRFLYSPATDENGLGLNLLQGTIAYVSGRIAKLAPEQVAITTPVATLGVRGTRFAITVTGN